MVSVQNLKFLIQIILALIGIFIFYFYSGSNEIENLYFPFFKNLVINLGLVFYSILFVCYSWVF